MGGKYEVRYWLDHPTEDGIGYNTVYTNSWLVYMKLRLAKRIIYYCVRP